MGRSGTVLFAVLTIGSVAVLFGCGGSPPPTPGFGVPAVVKISPTPTASMDLGSTLQFTASALNGNRGPLVTTFTYSSNKPSVVSIASNGLACAGTWDSLTIPVVCTPGGAGTAQITASSSGVVSAPVTVYVHEHINRISVTPIVSSGPGPGVDGCFTASGSSSTTAHSITYTATALTDDASGQPTIDITSTVGPFTWGTLQPSVVTLTPLSTHGIPNGTVQVSARVPGLTQVFATVANANSGPQTFKTCAVQQISVSVNGSTSVNLAKGTGATAVASVVDTEGNAISAPLTWSSSTPAVATVSAAGAITNTNVGGAAITASCTPPTCNINLSPAQPIYPKSSVAMTYTGKTTTAFNLYVSTKSQQCIAKTNCTALLVPVSGSPPVAATGVQLPGVPNSIQFDPKGSVLYGGTQKGLARILVTANPPTITITPTVTGKVLAISPDSKKVIVADTQSPVNQVFILDSATGASTNLLINGATAAAFSPDALKAFIVAGTNLYVYSTVAPLQVGTLTSAGTDVDFLANGMFGFIGQGAAGSSYLATCDDPGTPVTSQIGSVSAPADLIRALPDGSGMIGLSPPNVTLIDTPISGTPATGQSGCPTPLGALTLAPTVTSFDLGQGTFIPVAFLVSSDGQKAYIVPPSGDVIVFDIIGRVTSFLPLVGSPHALAAALAPDGQTLYVSADDSKVHVINTVAGGDVQQVPVPSSSLCAVTSGGPPPTCLPDVLAVRP